MKSKKKRRNKKKFGRKREWETKPNLINYFINIKSDKKIDFVKLRKSSQDAFDWIKSLKKKIKKRTEKGRTEETGNMRIELQHFHKWFP